MIVQNHSAASAKTVVEEQSWRLALWAVFAVTVARLVWLAIGHTDLYPDEAQYWIWSRHPALGYYSKPPVVAWAIALTTAFFGEDEMAVRLSAPLLHFGASLVVFALARRLYDSRVAMWSAIAYATLPGVSASSAIMSTDAPLLLCWAVALYAFIRAREADEWRWWIGAGVAAGVGLLAKYAMAYWLLSALLFLLIFRDERRHLRRFLASAALALLIYSPNFVWNALNGFVSYRHTRDNADLGGVLFHPDHFLEFFGSQFAVFGPIFFGALILVTILARRSFADRRAALLAVFALPTLAMMLVVSFLSRAQPNWSAPTFVSATVLVVAWLLVHGRAILVTASILLNIAIAVVAFGMHDAAMALGVQLPAKYDPLHRLRGWHVLGRTVGTMLLKHPGTVLMADDRELMAALVYYVFPHPFNALKWNGEGGVHDEFDLTAQPSRYVGADFLLISREAGNVQRIIDRFEAVTAIDHITIPIGGGDFRVYQAYWLKGFKGYR